MLLSQMNVSSRGNLLLDFIFADSESEPLKPREEAAGSDLVETMRLL